MFPRGPPLTPWVAEKRGGGGNPRKSPARRVAPAAFAAVLTALAVAPSATMAQTCASAPTVAGTPSAAPSAWTFGGTLASTDTGISCNTLTNGLDMTLGPGLEMGTGTPLTERGIYVDAEGDGNGDVTVKGAAVIHSSQSGIYMKRDGTGLLGLELTGGRIVVTGALEGKGIRLAHKGKANADSKGVRIVSGADIDLSGQTSASKTGIAVTTVDAPAASGRATTTVPVTVRVTGGTIDVGTLAGEKGRAVSVNQYAKGDTDITVEPGASLGREGSVAADYGIYVLHQATGEGDITITHRGRIYGGVGIYVRNESTSAKRGSITITTAPGSVTVAKGDAKDGMDVGIMKATATGDITITHNGGIEAEGDGIYTYNDGKGGITVTTGTGSTIMAKGAGSDGILAFSDATGDNGDITITHNGGIEAEGDGIYTYNDGKGGITVTTGTDSTIVAKGDGSDGILAWIGQATGISDIAITHNGGIDAGRIGIFTYSDGMGDVTVTTGRGSVIVARGDSASSSGINASVRDSATTGDVTVTHGGTVTAGDEGIYVSNRKASAAGTGTLGVTTTKGSVVTADKQGILVWHQGTGRFGVTVRGKVTGDSAYTGEGDTEYAGVRIQVKDTDTRAGGGGGIVIGERAHVSSKSGTAIRADARAGAVAVVLERDGYGLAGHLDGKILNADSTATAFSARTGKDGAATALKVGDRVDMRGRTTGVFDAVHRTRLATVTGGHEFKKLSETRVYHDRARVYEALPSVLLDLVRPASLAGRASVTRDGAAATRGTARGGGRVWARLEAGDGKRRAAASTTGKGYRGVALAWDTERRSVEAGLELPAGDRLALGLGVRHLRGKATVKGGGRIDVSGLGLGLSVAHTGAGGLYIDGRLSHTRFGDIDLASDARGSVVSNLSGDGFAAGVGVGRRIAREGVALTPRGGLAWSSVSLGAFDDVAGVGGGGRVVPGRTRSLVGGLGVLAEFGGSEGSSGRAFASLDLEREFSPDREVVASGTGLSSKVRATWLRLGLGGALDLNPSGAVRLSGRGHYATAGSGNTGYGGSVTLSLSF